MFGLEDKHPSTAIATKRRRGLVSDDETDSDDYSHLFAFFQCCMGGNYLSNPHHGRPFHRKVGAILPPVGAAGRPGVLARTSAGCPRVLARLARRVVRTGSGRSAVRAVLGAASLDRCRGPDE